MQGSWLEVAAGVAANFLHVQQCCLDNTSCDSLPETCTVKAVLPTLCQQLSHLESLQLLRWLMLDDQQLSTLARLPWLTVLQCKLACIGEAGCSALAAMTALQSLKVLCSHQKRHFHLDLRALTQLSHLAWLASDVIAALRASHVQLPSSLVHLQMDNLPALTEWYLPACPLQQPHPAVWQQASNSQGPPAGALPALTTLVLTRQRITDHQWALIAANCSNLVRLQLHSATLGRHCYAAPLTAVTELSAARLTTSKPFLKAHILPQLRKLSLLHAAKSLRLLRDLTNLQQLDVGSRATSFHTNSPTVLCDGMWLGAYDFQVLSMLPSLRALRACIKRGHIKHLCLLTQLHVVELVWEAWGAQVARDAQRSSGDDDPPIIFHFGSSDEEPEDVFDAQQLHFFKQEFETCCLPPLVHKVALDITTLQWHDALHDSAARLAEFNAMVDSAINYLARAGALATVHLSSNTCAGVACYAGARLTALTTNPHIQAIVIRSCHSGAVAKLAPDAQAVVRSLCARGVHVDVIADDEH